MRNLTQLVTGVLLLVEVVGCGDAPGAGDRQLDTTAVARTRVDTLLLASAKIALPPEGVAPGDLPHSASTGAELLVTYCTQCHALPAPDMHSATDWPGVIRRMWLRMGALPETLQVGVPSAVERFQLLQYLTTNALAVSEGTLPPGPGRDAFTRVCSQCHALPDPSIHTAENWPTVFSRMERNMERMQVVPPSNEDAARIVSYLQSVNAR